MEKVLIIGCAESGYWAAKLLRREGYEVIITDAKGISQKAELENLGVSVYDNGHPDALLREDYAFIVKNPGIRYNVPFVKWFVDHNLPIICEIEAALAYAPDFVYGAITGTNGKTTTTSMLYEILKTEKTAYASGNIGTALSNTVYNHGQEKASIALEISAFQLMSAPTFHPLVSVICNLTPDHLDFYETLDEYYDAKCLVYQNQEKDDWFLKNIDDEEIVKRCVNVNCRTVTYSLTKQADLMLKDGWVILFGEKLFRTDDLQVVGMHNVANAMVAAAMGYKMGISPENIRKALQDFKGIEHRIEYVGEINGARYYNDSKGTNVDSTVTALKAFDKPVILLAGGHDKHTGFDDLYNYTDKIKKLIVFGETKMELAKLKEDAVIVEDLKQACEVAYNIAEKGDVVLFSPACSSYDQFRNFEERGRIFKEIVLTLDL